MRAYIDMALADGKLKAYEIRLLRCRGVEFGDDPDEMEMFLKAEMARMLEETKEIKTVVITQKPAKNIFAHFWSTLRKYAAFKEEQYDKLAAHVRHHVDMERIYAMMQTEKPEEE